MRRTKPKDAAPDYIPGPVLDVEATALVLLPRITDEPITPKRVIDAWLAGRRASTLRGYQCDLRAWQSYIKQHVSPDLGDSIGSAVSYLFSLTAANANLRVMDYRCKMQDRKQGTASVARSIAALRSLSKLARTLGLINWTITVPIGQVIPYKDTSGPGLDGYLKMLHTTEDLRARLVLRLLFDMGLRRLEVHRLDMKDYEPGHAGKPANSIHPAIEAKSATLAVLGKKRDEKERLTLPEPTRIALEEYLRAERGKGDGPLLMNRWKTAIDRAAKDGDNEPRRMSCQSIYEMVVESGKRAGLEKRTRPHGLRHAAITAGLDATNGDVRAVARFSRHRNIQTVLTYDDNKRDLGGSVASLIAPE